MDAISVKTTPDSVVQGMQKELIAISQLQEQQLVCQKQLRNLYTRLASTFEQGQLLQNHKNQLYENKIHLATLSDPKQQANIQNLYQLRKQYIAAEAQHSALKKNIITSTSKIRELTKEIATTTETIEENESVFMQMKAQTEKLRARQAEFPNLLTQIQLATKRQTLRKIELIKSIEGRYDDTSGKRQQLMRMIRQMKKMNEALNELLLL